VNWRLLPVLLLSQLAACGGGAGGSYCDGSCGATPVRLEIADVQKVLAQGVAEAQARGAAGTLAVVDRVGNVLGVFRMSGADVSVTVEIGRASCRERVS
jgi:hypothetical protein